MARTKKPRSAAPQSIAMAVHASRVGPAPVAARAAPRVSQQDTEDAQLRQALAASRAMHAASFEDAELERAIQASKALAEEQEALDAALAQSTATVSCVGVTTFDSSGYRMLAGGYAPSLGSKMISASAATVAPKPAFSKSSFAPTSASGSGSGDRSSGSSGSSSSSSSSSRGTTAPKLTAYPPASLVASSPHKHDEGLELVLRASALAAEAEEAALAQAIAASIAIDATSKPKHHPGKLVTATDAADDPMLNAEPALQTHTPDVPKAASLSEEAAQILKAKEEVSSWQSGDLFEAAQRRAAEIEAVVEMSADWFEEEEDDWLVVAAVDGPVFSIATPPSSPR